MITKKSCKKTNNYQKDGLLVRSPNKMLKSKFYKKSRKSRKTQPKQEEEEEEEEKQQQQRYKKSRRKGKTIEKKKDFINIIKNIASYKDTQRKDLLRMLSPPKTFKTDVFSYGDTCASSQPCPLQHFDPLLHITLADSALAIAAAVAAAVAVAPVLPAALPAAPAAVPGPGFFTIAELNTAVNTAVDPLNREIRDLRIQLADAANDLVLEQSNTSRTRDQLNAANTALAAAVDAARGLFTVAQHDAAVNAAVVPLNQTITDLERELAAAVMARNNALGQRDAAEIARDAALATLAAPTATPAPVLFDDTLHITRVDSNNAMNSLNEQIINLTKELDAARNALATVAVAVDPTFDPRVTMTIDNRRDNILQAVSDNKILITDLQDAVTEMNKELELAEKQRLEIEIQRDEAIRAGIDKNLNEINRIALDMFTSEAKKYESYTSSDEYAELVNEIILDHKKEGILTDAEIMYGMKAFLETREIIVFSSGKSFADGSKDDRAKMFAKLAKVAEEKQKLADIFELLNNTGDTDLIEKSKEIFQSIEQKESKFFDSLEKNLKNESTLPIITSKSPLVDDATLENLNDNIEKLKRLMLNKIYQEVSKEDFEAICKHYEIIPPKPEEKIVKIDLKAINQQVVVYFKKIFYIMDELDKKEIDTAKIRENLSMLESFFENPIEALRGETEPIPTIKEEVEPIKVAPKANFLQDILTKPKLKPPPELTPLIHGLPVDHYNFLLKKINDHLGEAVHETKKKYLIDALNDTYDKVRNQYLKEKYENIRTELKKYINESDENIIKFFNKFNHEEYAPQRQQINELIDELESKPQVESTPVKPSTANFLQQIRARPQLESTPQIESTPFKYGLSINHYNFLLNKINQYLGEGGKKKVLIDALNDKYKDSKIKKLKKKYENIKKKLKTFSNLSEDLKIQLFFNTFIEDEYADEDDSDNDDADADSDSDVAVATAEDLHAKETEIINKKIESVNAEKLKLEESLKIAQEIYKEKYPTGKRYHEFPQIAEIARKTTELAGLKTALEKENELLNKRIEERDAKNLASEKEARDTNKDGKKYRKNSRKNRKKRRSDGKTHKKNASRSKNLKKKKISEERPTKISPRKTKKSHK